MLWTISCFGKFSNSFLSLKYKLRHRSFVTSAFCICFRLSAQINSLFNPIGVSAAPELMIFDKQIIGGFIDSFSSLHSGHWCCVVTPHLNNLSLVLTLPRQPIGVWRLISPKLHLLRWYKAVLNIEPNKAGVDSHRKHNVKLQFMQEFTVVITFSRTKVSLTATGKFSNQPNGAFNFMLFYFLTRFLLILCYGFNQY